ncbi:MAG: DUF554 domain-containing protein [Eubacteriales bacterium]|nr:DUF554 domain-containing protein [Eubacteriales bacterium]
MGTIINVAAVVLGGILGKFINGSAVKKYEATLMHALGLCTLFIGISGTLSGMLVIKDGSFETRGTMLMIFSMVLGALAGELFGIEERLTHLGERIKRAVGAAKDARFVESFMANMLVICIGAMAIIGPLQDGLTGDYSMLAAKAALDGVITLIFASTLGIGAAFAAIPLGIYQGSITLLAHVIEPYLSDLLIQDLSLMGSVLITGVGINLIFNKGIRLANMLPALLGPIIYHLFLIQFF